MKYLILFLSIFIVSCKRISETLAYNVNAEIVSMNGNEQTFNQDKFHTPTTCNIILIKALNANVKNQYAELNSCNLRRDYPKNEIYLTTSWMYNHNVGDTIHFKYIDSKRFFTIKKRN